MPAWSAHNAATRCGAACQGLQTDIATRHQTRALVICGPTSSGKSEIALRVAESVGGEIVNADSRQVYRGMNIGTGMPAPRAFERVPHHLYAFVEPAQGYSAARFVADAYAAVCDICRRGRLPIIAGGTGFYIEALMGTMPLDRPPADEALRARLRREAGLHPPEVLWDWLAALRSPLAAGIRRRDSYRILRGLERAITGRREGKPASVRDLRSTRFAVALLGVRRSVLRSRIAARVGEMFAGGLVREAHAVQTIAPHAPALSGLGYAEALAFYDGLATYEEAVATAVRRTEQYARRQETWFRRLRNIVLVNAEDRELAIASITAMARELLTLK